MGTSMYVLCLVAQSCLILCDHSPPGSFVHENSSDKNIGVSCHSLLLGIFPNQGLNPALLHCRQILYHLSHQGSPWILECIAYPFSRGSSTPRNWARISCIAGIFFTSWATWEAHMYVYIYTHIQSKYWLGLKSCIVNVLYADLRNCKQ